MSLYESGEMYLESILVLTKQGKSIRAIDLCEYMGYSKPSVSRALSILKKSGHVEVDKNGHIQLTEEGTIVAEKIYERHKVLTELFITIGVDEETAIEDSCRIEHCLSDVTFEKIKEHIEIFRELKK